jgi:heme/copper-type cytochrome/quinol oxidase subunit 4
MQLGENMHRARRNIVIAIILTLAVIQIVFGLIGILRTYYAST